MLILSPTRLRTLSLCAWLALAPIIISREQGVFAATDGAKVLELGVFDGSSNEFAQGTPERLVEVDAQRRRRNRTVVWEFSQPRRRGISGNWKANRISAAPRTIWFAIAGAPAAAYRLHIALLLESRSVPALRICINGKCGVFYLESPLDAHMGDSDDTFESVHAPADLSFVFPQGELPAHGRKHSFISR